MPIKIYNIKQNIFFVLIWLTSALIKEQKLKQMAKNLYIKNALKRISFIPKFSDF